MLHPEKILVRTGLSLFVLAAVLEGLSRLRHRPDLHAAALWVSIGALFVGLVPVAIVGVVLGFQALVGLAGRHNGS